MHPSEAWVKIVINLDRSEIVFFSFLFLLSYFLVYFFWPRMTCRTGHNKDWHYRIPRINLPTLHPNNSVFALCQRHSYSLRCALVTRLGDDHRGVLLEGARIDTLYRKTNDAMKYDPHNKLYGWLGRQLNKQGETGWIWISQPKENYQSSLKESIEDIPN